MTRRPTVRPRDELMQEVYTLLQQRFEPIDAVEFLLRMFSSFDLTQIRRELMEAKQRDERLPTSH